ncbi:chemosensory receptor C [Elysia marginata]|uniref:Chemosensory receptor C n=1 Tax=Elysia marginata TaxID=1093978 RepID=A0AAV4I4T6_9GAST|nr:chemosensory receptor C [Elysia marginata]
MINLTHPFKPESFIFMKEFFTLHSFIYNVWVCILLFGVASNAINLTVFSKIGFRDSVTVALLFLSLSDLLSLVLSIPTVTMWFVTQHWPDHHWPFDKFLHIAFYWYSQVFYDFSSFISVFLGLMRCACVAKPLLFKSVFTINRTLIVLGVLLLVALSLRIPVLISFRFICALKPQTNSTWLFFLAAPNSRQTNAVLDIVNRNVVPWMALIISVACVTSIKTPPGCQISTMFSIADCSSWVDRQREGHFLPQTQLCSSAWYGEKCKTVQKSKR